MHRIQTVSAAACPQRSVPFGGGLEQRLTLQDLGSLGELIGAIGVMISLVYIALQVRQNTRQIDENTRSVQVSALLAARSGSSEFNLRVISNNELARVYRLGLGNSPRLTRDERLRFDVMLAETFRNYQTLYFLKRDAALPIEEWISLSRNIEQLLTAPGVADWWERTGIPFNKDFVGFVESLRNEETRETQGAQMPHS